MALLIAMPVLAAAAPAVTSTAVNMRAGPDADYPLVRWLPEGTTVDVIGCVPEYQWCDVFALGDRGWVNARYLSTMVQSRYAPLITYAPVIGLPIITFTLGSYWDDHYRHRRWFNDRQRWANRPVYVTPPPVYRPPPPNRVVRPPEVRPPAIRHPDYRRPDDRRPEYRPPAPRPPEVRPPAPRPPEIRQPVPRQPEVREPSFRPPTNRPMENRAPAMPSPRVAPAPSSPRTAPTPSPRQAPDNRGSDRPPGVLR